MPLSRWSRHPSRTSVQPPEHLRDTFAPSRKRARSIIRLALAAVLTGLSCQSLAVQRLVTPSFEVTIDVRCGEGAVGCKQVQYTGMHRTSGRSITLTGETFHSRCADGVTPCRFLGYVFKNGSTVYTVLDSGMLIVEQGSKVLVNEQGRGSSVNADHAIRGDRATGTGRVT